jgi:hypothetical protein
MSNRNPQNPYPPKFNMLQCEARVIDVQPGQKVLATVPVQLSGSDMIRLRQKIAQFLGIEESRVLVLPLGIVLGSITIDEVQEAEEPVLTKGSDEETEAH